MVEKGQYAYLDNKIYCIRDSEQGKMPDYNLIEIDSNSLQYARTVFEGIIANMGRHGYPNIFALGQHMERMKNGAEFLNLVSKTSPVWPGFESAIIDMMSLNFPGRDRIYARPFVYTGGGLGVGRGEGVHFGIACEVWPDYAPGDAIVLMPHTLRAVDLFHLKQLSTLKANVKSSGLYEDSGNAKSRIIKEFDPSLGICEPLILNIMMNVAELSGANLIVNINGKLYTPSLASNILGGITRAAIMKMHLVEEKALGLDEVLANSSELIACGTAMSTKSINTIYVVKELADELVESAVISRNTHEIGLKNVVETVRTTKDGEPVPISLLAYKIENKSDVSFAEQISKGYLEAVRGERDEFKHMLTRVPSKPSDIIQEKARIARQQGIQKAEFLANINRAKVLA